MTVATGTAFGLTRTMRDCLLVIQELTALDGVAPKLDEIAHEMCFANRGRVQRLILDLKDRGYIDWLPYRRRSIVVLRPIPMPAEPEFVVLSDAPPPEAA